MKGMVIKMKQLILLTIEMAYGAIREALHPVVLLDDANCVLVDCGYVGSLPKLEDELKQKDIQPEKITHIILSHQDHDHMGAAAAFKSKYPDVRILASTKEAPYISGLNK